MRLYLYIKTAEKPIYCPSYRPASSTSYISKIFEKNSSYEGVPNLTNLNIITKFQKDLLSCESTTKVFFYCLIECTLMFEGQKNIVIVFSDLEQAFDSLAHEK